MPDLPSHFSSDSERGSADEFVVRLVCKDTYTTDMLTEIRHSFLLTPDSNLGPIQAGMWVYAKAGQFTPGRRYLMSIVGEINAAGDSELRSGRVVGRARVEPMDSDQPPD